MEARVSALATRTSLQTRGAAPPTQHLNESHTDVTDIHKTEIAVILDRSGSMASIQHEMVSGFAQFVQRQAAEPGDCVLSLYRFDDKYDVVYEERPLAKVRRLSLSPRGSTALLDAVGRSIARIGERLAAKPEHQRPGTVIVMIITDGQENASIEVSRDVLKTMIERQEKVFNWQFMYLGADASTFDEAASLGISAPACYSPSARGVERLYEASSLSVASIRQRIASGETSARISIPRTLSDD